MNPGESPNGREADSIPEGGILAALPRARPQRASARRAAARATTASKTTTAPRASAAGKTSPATKTKPASTAATKKSEPTAETTKGSKSEATAETTKGSATTKGRAVKQMAKPAAKPIAKPAPKPTEPPAPKQGYEPEEEIELGKTVNPPSGVELVESVADIVGEIANSSIAAGGRLLKDAFSLLRRP